MEYFPLKHITQPFPDGEAQLITLQLAETGVDTLPPYTRRRSDAAPIPLADLNYTIPRAQSPFESRGSTISSPRGSIDRHSSDWRLSERIRRVSGSMLPKCHQRFQDHGRREN